MTSNKFERKRERGGESEREKIVFYAYLKTEFNPFFFVYGKNERKRLNKIFLEGKFMKNVCVRVFVRLRVYKV